MKHRLNWIVSGALFGASCALMGVPGGMDAANAAPAWTPQDAGENDAARYSCPVAQNRRDWERGMRLQDEQNTIDIFNDYASVTVFVTQNKLVRGWRVAREEAVGAGSGFVWDSSGHIVTNYHVIAGSSSVTVTLYNQKTYPARLVGAEPKKDIAVLKIDAPASELKPIVQPVDGYELSVGQKAIAIGNPFGLDHTLTTGIISAMGREQYGIGGVTIRDMIQTDASINPGNSGGPLLDSAGRLIGMNTMIYSKSGTSSGVGFAVPYTTIKRVVPQIIKTGKAQQLGIGVSIVPDNVARRNNIRGVVIRDVNDGSPAEKAGLRGLSFTTRGTIIGDVIIGVDDKSIQNYDELYNALDAHEAGDTVMLKIRRDGDEIHTIPVKVYVLPD